MGTLLIAGPLALDDHPEQPRLIGGVGGYAAIAAAPLAPTQLWCRGGCDFTHQMKDLLDKRRIDLAGVEWDGPTPRGFASGFVAGGPLLPETEPTSADGLGGALLIGLPPDEMRRAMRVVAALPDGKDRLLIVSPRPADLSDVTFRRELLAVTDVLVLSVAKALLLTGEATPLAAAQAFQADGAKAVVLTGPLRSMTLSTSAACLACFCWINTNAYSERRSISVSRGILPRICINAVAASVNWLR